MKVGSFHRVARALRAAGPNPLPQVVVGIPLIASSRACRRSDRVFDIIVKTQVCVQAGTQSQS